MFYCGDRDMRKKREREWVVYLFNEFYPTAITLPPTTRVSVLAFDTSYVIHEWNTCRISIVFAVFSLKFGTVLFGVDRWDWEEFKGFQWYLWTVHHHVTTWNGWWWWGIWWSWAHIHHHHPISTVRWVWTRDCFFHQHLFRPTFSAIIFIHHFPLRFSSISLYFAKEPQMIIIQCFFFICSKEINKLISTKKRESVF